MRIAIVDDQQVETKILTKYITKFKEESGLDNLEVFTFKNADEYLASFSEGAYALSFLDILMDNMNGVELARAIREKDEAMKIVFCTSSNEYAAESYEVNASMYLLKPYTYQQFKTVIKSVLPKQHSAKLAVVLEDGTRVILRNILYTDYFNHKITIHSKVGEDMYFRGNQAEFEEYFTDYDFIVPCNRGILLNLFEIKSVDSSSVTMSNGANPPVSRSHISSIKEGFKRCQMIKLKENL